MAQSTNVVAALTERLKTLPIYPIFENCLEKDNVTALQFMCIVDFHANYYVKLYDRIKEIQQPKLLGQLLQFRQFEKFKYFHYPVNKQYGNYVLQCKYCPLVGPCGCILTHMAINHNVHTALKTCLFCNSQPLQTHLDNKSLPHCYRKYIERNEIEIDVNVCGIVTIFYEMLRKLSQTLNICSTRRKGYAGQGYRYKEILSQDYGGDISPECEVRYMIAKKQLNRTIRSESLDREFRRIMEISCGGFYPSFPSQDQSLVENVIEIDSDDDDEVNNMTVRNGAVDASQYCDTESGQQQLLLQNPHTLPGGLQNDEIIPENLIKDEPRFNNSPTPTTSSYSFQMPSTSTPMERRLSRLSTFTSASQQCSNWTPTNESEEFALNIARKLDKIPQNKRRQLEIDIEMKILKTEMEAIEEGSLQ